MDGWEEVFLCVVIISKPHKGLILICLWRRKHFEGWAYLMRMMFKMDD